MSTPYHETMLLTHSSLCIFSTYELNKYFILSILDTPQAFQIITPAITPWVGGRDYPRNPSFATFQYSDTDYSIEDMTLYWLNLANNNAQWVQLYKFRWVKQAT